MDTANKAMTQSRQLRDPLLGHQPPPETLMESTGIFDRLKEKSATLLIICLTFLKDRREGSTRKKPNYAEVNFHLAFMKGNKR